MNKKRLIIIILVIIAIWYFALRDKTAPVSAPETEIREDAEEQITKQIEENAGPSGAAPDQEPVEAGKARVHYFTKEALEACRTETVALEQAVDPKYGHPAAGALVAQTSPMPADAGGDYISALSPGTRLIVMNIATDGIATADYSKALSDELNDCNTAQRRAQIVNTLKEFSQIKEVIITINGEVWE
ncbi:GerMN domain-containing protein [Candidatus Uhrbacteria bacterium]|nr:GerMN domain-containing protein [Candidatus Uhrbacteria bacterium]